MGDYQPHTSESQKHFGGLPPQIYKDMARGSRHFQISIPADSYAHWHLGTAHQYSEKDSPFRQVIFLLLNKYYNDNYLIG